MCTLIFSCGGSLIGVWGILPGILVGILVDQALFLWYWDRQLRAFLDEGRPMRWLRGLESRLLYLRWWIVFIQRTMGQTGLDPSLMIHEALQVLLGNLARWPGLIRITQEIVERHLFLIIRNPQDLWRGAKFLPKSSQTWLLRKMLDSCTTIRGFVAEDFQYFLDLGMCMNYSAREFKILVYACTPITEPKEQDPKEWYAQQKILQDILVDSYAFSYMEQVK